MGGRCYSNHELFDDNMHVEIGGHFINLDQRDIQKLCRSWGLKLEELTLCQEKEQSGPETQHNAPMVSNAVAKGIAIVDLEMKQKI